MSNLTSVGVTNGVPTAGTGTVSTIDALLAELPTALGPNGGLKVDNTSSTTPLLARIYDGTNGASIRGTNSPANAGDPALVVTLSPNSPVVGTATTSAPTYTNNTPNALSLDTSGNLRVTGGTSGSVAQGSTTAGQTGNLMQGAVTTGSPTYTTAQTNPLSLDTSGNLRVNVVAGGAGGGIVTQSTASNLKTQSQVSDGTNTAAVKAASTAPLSTDPALVVTISPNSLNANGQTTASASAPVVLASDKGLLAIGHTALPTAVSDGTVTPFITDKVGRQICVGSIRDLKGEASLTLTSSTSETTLIAAAASTFNDLYGLIISNTSGTASEVIIRDATAGGTARSFMVPAGDTRGFMLPEGAAMKQAAVNNNWTAQCSTGVTSIKIDALYVKNI